MAKFKYYNGSQWIELAQKSDIPSLSGYATQSWVNTQLSGYQTALGFTPLKNYGSDTSRPNGTSFTFSTGSNAVQMRSGATSGADIGIFYLSDDNSFLCNSGDSGYNFAVFDCDKGADFSSADNAAFAILQSWAGIKMKGDLTVGGSISEGGTALSSKYLGISSQAADSAKLNGQAASYYLNYNNLSNKPTIPTVPTNVSAFTNDAGYITSSALSGYATQQWVNQQGFITTDNNTWRPIAVGGTTKLSDTSTTINFAGSGTTSVSYSNGTITITSNDSFTGYSSSNKLDGAYINNTQGWSSFSGYTSSNKLSTSYIQNDAGWTANAGTVTSVGAGTGLSISGTASVNPTVNIASGYKLPTTTEWSNKADSSALSGYLPLTAGSSYPLSGDLYMATHSIHADMGYFNGIRCTSGREQDYDLGIGGDGFDNPVMQFSITGGTVNEYFYLDSQYGGGTIATQEWVSSNYSLTEHNIEISNTNYKAKITFVSSSSTAITTAAALAAALYSAGFTSSANSLQASGFYGTTGLSALILGVYASSSSNINIYYQTLVSTNNTMTTIQIAPSTSTLQSNPTTVTDKTRSL